MAPFQKYLSCPKVVFPDKHKIAFFAFKICTGEYILCSFGLCVPKLYFHLNLKWHCLHLNRIQDPLKTLEDAWINQNLCFCFFWKIPIQYIHIQYIYVYNLYNIYNIYNFIYFLFFALSWYLTIYRLCFGVIYIHNTIIFSVQYHIHNI